MSDAARVILHVVTMMTVVALVALGQVELATGIAVGAVLPSPVSTIVRNITTRRLDR